MFDLRYHVASLAAVFLALVLGIVVGAAISDPGLAERTEQENLREQIDRLNRALEGAELSARQGESAQAFARAAYEPLMRDRLAGKRIVVVSVGAVDDRVEEAVEAVRDAGGSIVRMRALKLPADAAPIERAIAARPALEGYLGPGHLDDVGRDFGRELVDGGDATPLGDVLSDVLVQERGRDSTGSADAVVVARPAVPQQGPLARFVLGLYEGLSGIERAVGVELSSAERPALPAFNRAGLSTVGGIDTAAGKVALAVLLAGGRPGDYGLAGADGVVPPIEPVVRPANADS